MKRTNSIIPLKRFKRLILRNAGNQVVYRQFNPMFRDGFVQESIAHLAIKTQGFRPAIMFVNGEYWGVHNIMEDNDSRSIENHFGISSDSIVIIEHNLEGRSKLSEGSSGDEQEYKDLVNFVSTNDMNLDANYNYLLSKIDSNSFCDHWVATIYTDKTNFDHNTTFWRYKGNAINTDGGDGKWRWAENDFDAAFNDPNSNTYWYALTSGPDFLFSTVVNNFRFQKLFLNRMCDELNTAFKTSYLLPKYYAMRSAFLPEINDHIGRWASPSSYNDWENAIAIDKNFIEKRPVVVKQFLMAHFALDTMKIQLNVSDTAHGYVGINTIEINKNTKGLENSTSLYPWTGTYFKLMPITLKAKALPGYKFVKWQETNDTTTEITVTAISDLTYTALFTEDSTNTPEKKIYINELMAENNITISDNKNQKEDWIEIYNDKNDTIDLAGYIFSDGYKTHRIPDGSDSTKIAPKGFKLFWADDDKKQGVTHLNFKLSKEKDEVMLFSPDRNELIDAISFSNQLGDISYGRRTDGASTWVYFSRGTPEASNNPRISAYYKNELNVFPVPASDYINITLQDVEEQILDIEYYDLLGRKLISLQQNYKSGELITNDISILTTGFYTIRIQGSTFKKNLTFIKH